MSSMPRDSPSLFLDQSHFSAANRSPRSNFNKTPVNAADMIRVTAGNAGEDSLMQPTHGSFNSNFLQKHSPKHGISNFTNTVKDAYDLELDKCSLEES